MTTPTFMPTRGTPRRTPMAQTTQPLDYPAPVGGMNLMQPLSMTPITDCIYAYNMNATDLGLKVRTGWKNLVFNVLAPARTLIGYTGSQEDGSKDYLFACTVNGITEVSTGTPMGVLSWPSQTGNAGYCTWDIYVNDNGDRYLLVADEENGLYQWEEATETWSVSTITGPVVTNISHVVVFKERIWVVENDSDVAWYLPTGALTGAATKFNFGRQIKRGGNLVGLWNWTLDGGDGIDDYLVAITSAGGVAVYRGFDPANASTWEMVGVWYVGRVPPGHKIADEYGGDLYILSESGIVNLTQLMSGASHDQAAIATTAKITPLIRDRMRDDLDERGWEIQFALNEDCMIIHSPNDPDIEYVRNLTTGGWTLWRGLDITTSTTWKGKFYFGQSNNSIRVMDGFQDGATEIEWSMLTAYVAPDGLGAWKRAHFVRPHFIATGEPGYSIQARYDYDLDEVLFSPVFTGEGTAVWDVGVWDEAVWGGATVPYDSVRGTRGMGHAVAIALRGKSNQRTYLVALTGMLDRGGLL